MLNYPEGQIQIFGGKGFVLRRICSIKRVSIDLGLREFRRDLLMSDKAMSMQRILDFESLFSH